jgi:hypothetical protein
MATLVHRLSTPLILLDQVYRAEVWGDRRDDGLWEGWIEFVPANAGPALSTGRETSQSNLEALTYWATGLQPVYLEGALARAIEKSPYAA